jgi:hypothetical protein
MSQQITRIVVHCSDSKFGDVELIRKWHTDPPRNWKDIGYHYVICNGYPKSLRDEFNPEYNGLLQAGRKLDSDSFIDAEEVGAHAGGACNFNSIGICMIGVNKFTLEQFDTLYTILRRWYKQIPTIDIIGHYAVPNSGKTCPNFDVDPIEVLVKTPKVVDLSRQLKDIYGDVLKFDPKLTI